MASYSSLSSSLSLSSSSSSNSTSQSPSGPKPQSYPNQSTWLNLMKKLSSLKSSSQPEHPRSSIVLFSDSAGLLPTSNMKTKVPTDNLILDEFLKNNGGYLDDSDSSDSEEAEDYHPNEINHNKHTIRVLEKKYEHETDSDNPTLNPFIYFNLPIKFFKLNLNRPERHHQNVATITRKQLDNQKITKVHQGGHHQTLRTTHHQNYHLSRLHSPLSYQQTHDEHDEPIQFVRNKNDRFKLNGLHPPSNQPFQSPRHNDINDQQIKGEDCNLNLKYIRSSTFPTNNSIIDSGLHRDHHHDHRQPIMVTENNDSHAKKLKSPFRNLVLGQDGLLRSI